MSARVFFNVLILLTFVKIGVLWQFSHRVLEHHKMTLPRSWLGKALLAPSYLADWNADVFFSIALAFLIIAFFLQPHYLTTLLYFWLTLNLYVIYLPFASGSDMVTFMLALWLIPVATRPQISSENGRIWQKAFFNVGLFLCQLQVVFIYFISGADKLQNAAWRSGVAVDYITHLNTMFNPVLTGTFDNPLVHLLFSWAIIIFELGFVVLVWFKRTRLMALAAGIFFHLLIWTVMSLPDFAAVMMASYLVFVKDSELRRFRNLVRRLLP
jgi:hypothetical protein